MGEWLRRLERVNNDIPNIKIALLVMGCSTIFQFDAFLTSKSGVKLVSIDLQIGYSNHIHLETPFYSSLTPDFIIKQNFRRIKR